MSSSAAWNNTSLLARVGPKRGSRLNALGRRSGRGGYALPLVAFALGLIVGLPVLGWWLWPARLSNARPAELAPIYAEAYIAMAADSYALSGDLPLAQARLATWDESLVAATLSALEDDAIKAGSQVQAKRLQQLRQDLGLRAATGVSARAQEPSAAPTAPAVARAEPGLGALPVLLALIVGVGLVGGGFIVYKQAGLPSVSGTIATLRAMRLPRLKMPALRRAAAPERERAAEPAVAPAAAVCEEEISLDQAFSLLAEELDYEEPVEAVRVAEQVAPRVRDAAAGPIVGTFLASYRHNTGEPFDTSYSIETEDGEFLGECGVGVAETIGESSPERVCAMEVWLFDKRDVRTTTIVLASDYAMQDPETKDAVTGRGDTVRARAGHTVRLETVGLTLTVEVLGLHYADAADAPPKSYFQELTLELTAVSK